MPLPRPLFHWDPVRRSSTQGITVSSSVSHCSHSGDTLSLSNPSSHVFDSSNGLFPSCNPPLIPKSNIQCWFKCTANFHPGVRVLEAQTLHPAEASSLNSGYSGSFAKAPHLEQAPHLLWSTSFLLKGFSSPSLRP